MSFLKKLLLFLLCISTFVEAKETKKSHKYLEQKPKNSINIETNIYDKNIFFILL